VPAGVDDGLELKSAVRLGPLANLREVRHLADRSWPQSSENEQWQAFHTGGCGHPPGKPRFPPPERIRNWKLHAYEYLGSTDCSKSRSCRKPLKGRRVALLAHPRPP